MKPNFPSTTLLAVTTAVISSFTLMGSASAVSFDSQETTDNFNSVYEYLRDGERDPLNTSVAPGGSRLVDLDNLILNYDSDVSITFLGEGTIKNNHLKYSVNGEDNDFIWRSLSAAKDTATIDYEENFLQYGTLGNTLDKNGSMQYGDSKSLGSFAAGDQFEFLLSAGRLNVSGVRDEFSSLSGKNPDGLQHAVAYALDDRYMLLGFEDLYGELNGNDAANFYEDSDRDFNDVLFLVDMGKGNLEKVPEPATTSALFAAGALGLFGVRRRKNS
jgi:hypothetical protein